MFDALGVDADKASNRPSKQIAAPTLGPWNLLLSFFPGNDGIRPTDFPTAHTIKSLPCSQTFPRGLPHSLSAVLYSLFIYFGASQCDSMLWSALGVSLSILLNFLQTAALMWLKGTDSFGWLHLLVKLGAGTGEPTVQVLIMFNTVTSGSGGLRQGDILVPIGVICAVGPWLLTYSLFGFIAIPLQVGLILGVFEAWLLKTGYMFGMGFFALGVFITVFGFLGLTLI